MRDFDYIIFGNNIGAMTAAVTLAKRHKVAVVNPSPNWGGIFAGANINGKQFDIGMVFLELMSFYPPADDLASYDPAVHNDSARFLYLIKDFLAPRINFTEVGNLKTLWNGVFYDDIMVANRLQFLSSFSGETKQKITNELMEISEKTRVPLHAAHKQSNQKLFLAAHYHAASVANHGDTLHDLLIAPFCQKTLNIPSQKISALLHRAAWCPLYYPETLLAAMRGQKLTMPDTRFHYPQADYFAKIIEILAIEMQNNANITLVRDNPVGLTAANSPTLFLTGGQITAQKIIWSGDLRQLFSLSNETVAPYRPDKSSMTLVFVEVEKKAIAENFSTVFVGDAKECIYRATNQNATNAELDRNKFIFEMNSDVLRQKSINGDEQIIAHTQHFVEQTAIFNMPMHGGQYAVKHFPNALTLPTAENLQKFEKLRDMTQSQLCNIEYIGPAAGFSTNSFNDQIVGALQLGAKYDSD